MKIINSITSELLTFVIVITNVLLSFINAAYASTITLKYNTNDSDNGIEITEDLDTSFDDTITVDDTKIHKLTYNVESIEIHCL